MITPALTPKLAAAADHALDSILKNGASAFGQKKPTAEVGFVAAAVLGGVPAIAHAWRPVLQSAGYSLSMNGVFCHQTPQATFSDAFGATASCELADLLLVVDDLTPAAGRRRWAALIQAKMTGSAGGKTISGSSDLRQLDLFTRWPSFHLPSGYHPSPRDFSTCTHAGQLRDCGSYGLIKPQPNPEWHQQMPALSMPPGGHTLGSFLAHMIESGQTGFGREATGSGDDWSRTIDELMTVTYASVFNYVAGFGASSPLPRGHSAIAFVAAPGPHRIGDPKLALIADHAPPSGEPPDRGEGLGLEGRGISIIRVGISRHEGL